MIDPRILREQPDLLRESQRRRGEDPSAVDLLVAADVGRRAAIAHFDTLRAEQKALGKKVAAATGDAKAELLEGTKALAAGVRAAQMEQDQAEARYAELLATMSNVVEDGVPEGGEDDYVVLREVGTPRDFGTDGFEARDHVELGAMLGAIDVERGAKDPDWTLVKDAAKRMAFAEDRAVLEGYSPAGIRGIRESSSNPRLTFPAEVARYPDVVSEAVTSLRLAGVGGPYSLLLGAAAYTAVNETSDYGYPVREHLARVIDGEILWAPAIDGGVVVSTRGGDYELALGQDLSIGYLSHDITAVTLYLHETMTFLVYTDEASVTIGAGSARARASRR